MTFDKPLGFLVNPTDDKTAYVIEQRGKVWQINFDSSAKSKKLILDISSRLGTKSEDGLLDMVFHPKFAKNKRVIISYRNKLPGEDRIASFKLTEKGIDPVSERIHFRINQPYEYGNNGQIAFGPDGYLYIGVGDGGKSNDPHNNAQNVKNLFGSILRIDISDLEKGYKIPKDNPFVNDKNAKAEIWAYGLRVPWRFSFDQKTGFLYCADVGQDRMEEINIIEKGKNYGWRVKEGNLDFKGSGATGAVYEKPIALIAIE